MNGKKRNYRVAGGDGAEEVLPEEKWLVAFRDQSSKKSADGTIFIRQFYAAGFYEAYDTIMTYAERKTGIEVLWFKEKRECGEQYISRKFLPLESFCTYCNRKFSHLEPIPCRKGGCSAEFCSRECMAQHTIMRHERKY